MELEQEIQEEVQMVVRGTTTVAGEIAPKATTALKKLDVPPLKLVAVKQTVAPATSAAAVPVTPTGTIATTSSTTTTPLNEKRKRTASGHYLNIINKDEAAIARASKESPSATPKASATVAASSSKSTNKTRKASGSSGPSPLQGPGGGSSSSRKKEKLYCICRKPYDNTK